MAESSTGEIIKWGLLGIAGWWLYSTFFSSSTSTPAASPAAGTSGGAASGSAPAGSTPAAPAPSSYSGPSLATLRSNLLAAMTAAVGSDAQVKCPSSSFDGTTAAAACQSQYTALMAAGSPANLAAPAALAACLADVQKAAAAAGTQTCTDPQATYDVFNWYLSNRAGLPSAFTPPDPPDHTSVIPLLQYWSWVNPLLQAQIKGLSGMGRWGMGHIGAIRSIVRAS